MFNQSVPLVFVPPLGSSALINGFIFIHFLQPHEKLPLLPRTVRRTENSLAMAKNMLLSVSAVCALHCMWTTVIFIVVPVPDYGVLKYMWM